MSLRQALRVIRRWRSIIVAGVVIGIVVGWLSAPGEVSAAPMFAATRTLLLDPQAGHGTQINQAAVRATLGDVPDRVAQRLGLSGRAVRAMVTAESRDNVNELLITARSGDGHQAEALANVTADELIAELGGKKSFLRTLEPAVAAPVPSDDIKGPTSGPGRALLLGLLGLVVGVAAAFGVDRFDNRIRAKRPAEEALGLPVVAEVPQLPRSARKKLITGAQRPAFVEAYRGLRTMVDAWTPGADGRSHRIIVVTSPGAGEGKTTTVAHLALMLAESGRSVLLMSADFHRPDLHSYFAQARDPGLTDVLRGAPGAPGLADLIAPTGVEGVYFVPSGAPVDNPGPLLEHAGDLLRAARKVADFVVVDSSSLLITSDAAELARHAGAVLLVFRAGRTSVGAGRRSVELLERLQIPVLGAVLVGSDTAPRLHWRARKSRGSKVEISS